jgi:hypothetical protein
VEIRELSLKDARLDLTSLGLKSYEDDLLLASSAGKWTVRTMTRIVKVCNVSFYQYFEIRGH